MAWRGFKCDYRAGPDDHSFAPAITLTETIELIRLSMDLNEEFLQTGQRGPVELQHDPGCNGDLCAMMSCGSSWVSDTTLRGPSYNLCWTGSDLLHITLDYQTGKLTLAQLEDRLTDYLEEWESRQISQEPHPPQDGIFETKVINQCTTLTSAIGCCLGHIVGTNPHAKCSSEADSPQLERKQVATTLEQVPKIHEQECGSELLASQKKTGECDTHEKQELEGTKLDASKPVSHTPTAIIPDPKFCGIQVGESGGCWRTIPRWDLALDSMMSAGMKFDIETEDANGNWGSTLPLEDTIEMLQFVIDLVDGDDSDCDSEEENSISDDEAYDSDDSCFVRPSLTKQKHDPQHQAEIWLDNYGEPIDLFSAYYLVEWAGDNMLHISYDEEEGMLTLVQLEEELTAIYEKQLKLKPRITVAEQINRLDWVALEKLADEEGEEAMQKIVDKVVRDTKDNLRDESNSSEILVGIDPTYLLATEFMESLSLSVDDATSIRYQEAVDSHDLRLVNNTFARIELNSVKTVKPSRKLIGGAYSSISTMSFITDRSTPGNADFEFLSDVAAAYCFNNTLDSEVTYGQEVFERLMKQKWFSITPTNKLTYYVSTEPEVDQMFMHDFTYFIAPVTTKDNSGTLPNNLGWHKTVNGITYWAFEGTTEGKTINRLAGIAAGENAVEIQGVHFHCVARKIFNAMQVVVLTPLKYNQITALESQEMYFDIPVLDHNILSNLGFPMLTTSRERLNKDLLNRLMTKNVTGKVSKDLLIEYGMSLSWFSYNKRGVELANTKIEPHDVDTHVYVARVLGAREEFTDWVHSKVLVPGLPKMATAFLAATLSTLLEATSSLQGDKMEAFVSNMMDKVRVPSMKSLLGSTLENWMSIDVWTHGSHVYEFHSNGVTMCEHHAMCVEPTTEWQCWCCLAMTANGPHARCACCTTLSRKCYHDIDPENHKDGNLNCDCCGEMSKTKLCDDCLLIRDIKITSTEAPIPTKGLKIAPHRTLNKETFPPLPELPSKPSKRQPKEITASHAEMAQFVPPNALAIMLGRVALDEIANLTPGKDRFSVIPFITLNMPVQSVMDFTISHELDVTTYDCGVDAVRYYTGANMTEMRIKATIGKTRGLGTLEIVKLLSEDRLNSAVVDATGVYFKRVNASEEFAVIIHETATQIKNPANHWLVGRLRWKTGAGVRYYGDPLSNSATHDAAAYSLFAAEFQELSPDEKAFLAYTLITKHNVEIKETANLPDFVEGKITNSLKHDPRSGLYNFKIPKPFTKYAQAMVTAVKTRSIPNELVAVWDVDLKSVGDVENNLEHGFRDKCLTIARFMYQPQVNGRPKRFDVLTDEKTSTQYIDLSTTKCKNGDVVMLRWGAEYKPVALNLQNGKQKVHSSVQARFNHVDVLIPKASIMSAIISLISYAKCKITSNDLEAVMRLNATRATSGPGGCGKSTRVGKFLKENPTLKALCVATTSGGVESLAKKTARSIPVLSFEKATYLEQETKYDMIIIDECTTVIPWTLALIMQPGVPIWFLGDPTQISVIDFNPSGGARAGVNLLQYYERFGEVEKITGSFRYGVTLCNKLAEHPAMRDLHSLREEGDTDVRERFLTRMVPMEVTDIFERCDVILCFYNEHVELLKRIVGRLRVVKICTVHSFQGLESKHVGVLQMSLDMPADTHLSFGHCISAATRAVDSLTWLSVGCFNDQTPLAKRLGSYIGSMNWSDIMSLNLMSQENLDVPLALPTVTTQDGEIQLNAEEQLSLIIEAVNNQEKLREFDPLKFDSQLFSQVAYHYAKFLGVTLDYEPNSHFEINLKVMMKSANIKYNFITQEFDLSAIPNATWRNGFDCMLANCCVADVPPQPTTVLKTEIIVKSRVRILSLYEKIRKANNLETKLTDNLGVEWTITTVGNSCAACAEMHFSSRVGEAVISKDYLSDEPRTISGTAAYLVNDLMHASEWSLLDSRFDDKQISQAILTERIHTWFKDTPSQITGFGSWMHYNKYENQMLRARLRKELDIEVAVNNYDDFSTYPFIKKITSTSLANPFKSTWKTSTIDHATDDRIISTVNGEPDLDDLIYQMMCRLCIKYQDQYGLRMISKFHMTKVGAKDLIKLPGMAETIEWHKTRNTNTYNELLSRVSANKVKSLANESPQYYLPKDVLDAMELVTNVTEGFSSNQRNTISDAFVSAADCYATRLMALNSRNNLHVLSSTIYLAYVTEREHVTCDFFQQDDASKMQFKMDNAVYMKMLSKHAGNLAATDPRYEAIQDEIEGRGSYRNTIPDSNKSTTDLLTGPFILQHRGLDLKSIHETWKSVTFWAPFNTVRHGQRVFKKLNNSNRLFEVHSDILLAMEQGRLIKGTNLKVHLLSSHGQIGIWSLNHNSVWMETVFTGQRTITIETPTILLDPEEILKTRDFIKTQMVTYNFDLVDNLYRRCLRPGTTWDDLQVQLRTLINTSQFSTHSVSARYKANIAHGKACLRLAWFTRQADLHRYSLLGLDEDSVIRPKEAGLLMLGKFVNSVLPQGDERDLAHGLEVLLDSLEPSLTGTVVALIEQVVKKFLNNLCKLKMALSSVNKRVIIGDIIQHSPQDVNILARAPKHWHRVTDGTHKFFWRNDCEACNSQNAIVLRSRLGVEILSMDVSLDGWTAIITNECRHDKTTGLVFNDAHSDTASRPEWFSYGANNHVDDLDVRIVPTITQNPITSQTLNYPRDASVLISHGSVCSLVSCVLEIDRKDLFSDLLCLAARKTKIVFTVPISHLTNELTHLNTYFKVITNATGQMVMQKMEIDFPYSEPTLSERLVQTLDGDDYILKTIANSRKPWQVQLQREPDRYTGESNRAVMDIYAASLGIEYHELKAITTRYAMPPPPGFSKVALVINNTDAELALAGYPHIELRFEYKWGTWSLNRRGLADRYRAYTLASTKRIDQFSQTYVFTQKQSEALEKNLRAIVESINVDRVSPSNPKVQLYWPFKGSCWSIVDIINMHIEPGIGEVWFADDVLHVGKTTNRLKVIEDPDYSYFDSLLSLGAESPALPPALNEALLQTHGSKEPIWVSSALELVMGKRMSVGRDLTAVTNVHFVATTFVEGAKLFGWHIKWLQNLRAQIMKLDPKPDDIWNVYSLKRGFAQRSPALTAGRHVYIGKRDKMFDDLGFECLELKMDPGRFGACLRVIFSILLPSFKKVYIRSGRPGFHVLYSERVQRELESEMIKGNYVVCPWNTFGPFLDGMVLQDPWDPTLAAQFLAADMNYGSVYGIDEANYKWFNIQTCYYSPNSTWGYSNMQLNPNLTQIQGAMQMVPMTGDTYEFPDVPSWIAWISTSNHTACLEATALLDPMIIVAETREPSLPQKRHSRVDKWVKERQELLDEKPINDNDFIQMFHTTWTWPQPYNDRLSFKVASITNVGQHLEIMYNPAVQRYCASDCFKWFINNEKSKNRHIEFDWNKLRAAFKYKPYVTILEIKQMCLALNVNCTIICNNVVEKSVLNMGPELCIWVTIDHMGYEHAQVVKPSWPPDLVWTDDSNTISTDVTMEQLIESLSKEKFVMDPGCELTNMVILDIDAYLNNKTGTLPNNLTEQFSARLLNAHQRCYGNFDIMMASTIGLVSNLHTTTIRHNSSRISGALDLHRVPSLIAGKVYLFPTTVGYVARLVWEQDGLPVVFGPDVPSQEFVPWVALDIGATVSSITRAPKRTLRSGASLGFINQGSKTWGMMNNWNGDLPVNDSADVLYLAEYDAVNHHGRPIFTSVKRATPNNIRVPSLNWQDGADLTWTTSMLQALAADGPIRLGLSNGYPTVHPAALNRWTGEHLMRIAHYHIKTKWQDETSLVNEWAKVKWRVSGNRLVPQADLIFDAITSFYRAKGYNPGQITTKEMEWSRGEKLQTTAGDIMGVLNIAYPNHCIVGPQDATLNCQLSKENFAIEQGPTIKFDATTIHDPERFVSLYFQMTGFGRHSPTSTEATLAEQLRDHTENFDPEYNSLDTINTIDGVKQEGIESQQYWAKQVKAADKEAGVKHDEQNLRTNDTLDIAPDKLQVLSTLDCLNTIKEQNWQEPVDTSDDVHAPSHMLVGQGVMTTAICGDFSGKIVGPIEMNYWDDETAMVDGSIPLPKRNIKLRTSDNFSGIKQMNKVTLAQYPSHSQPAYTKRTNAGVAAVSDLFGSHLTLRTVEHNPKEDANLFSKTYFIKESTKHLQSTGIDVKQILQWLRERPDRHQIAKDVEELLSEGFDVHGLDRVKVHMKLESRMKDVLINALKPEPVDDIRMPGTIEEQRNRLIVWQRKGITLIFAPLFATLKDNLKRVLKSNVVYTDGMTPNQIAALLNTVDGRDLILVEDDLAKQDRQTDATLIATEMEIYKILGANPALIEVWSLVHKQWKAKGLGLRFEGDASRHTGQATTALGNVIVNLLVHMHFVQKMGSSLKLMLVLGDDNIMLCKRGVTSKQVSENSARHFNMVSKPFINPHYGTFLRMIVYRNSMGQMECGPDIVRLERRHEVMNGTGAIKFAYYAVGIPSGEGKTKLAEQLPGLFVDHDSLIDKEKAEKLRPIQPGGDWTRMNSYLRSAPNPDDLRGRLLLTWSRDTCPEECEFLGNYVLAKAPKIKDDSHDKTIMAMNRLVALNDDIAYVMNTRTERNDKLKELILQLRQGTTTETIELRNMSYAVMLGGLPSLQKCAVQRGWPIKLQMWYEYSSLIAVTALKYNTTADDIEQHLNRLVGRMLRPQIFINSKLMMTSDNH
jgi:hypothetical protein